jgi:hypothetical protein
MALARFRGRLTKRPRPVFVVVLVVLQNSSGLFWRSFWSFYETAPLVLAVVLVILRNGPGPS